MRLRPFAKVLVDSKLARRVSDKLIAAVKVDDRFLVPSLMRRFSN